MPSVTVKVLTSDGLIMDVDEKVARFMLKSSDLRPDEKGVTHLAVVNSVILKKIIGWAKQYTEKNQNREKTSKFLNDQDPGTLFELISAAGYLKLQELLGPIWEKMSREQSPQETRQTFKITRDFSGIEEGEIDKENEWCEKQQNVS